MNVNIDTLSNDKVFKFKFKQPTHGNLENWAKQGVLLLNSTLTVTKYEANSHRFMKWNNFTDCIIENISKNKQNVVFILWGLDAQNKNKIINGDKH